MPKLCTTASTTANRREYWVSFLRPLSPSLRSGSVIDFGVTKIQAFTGKLKFMQDGIVKPVAFKEISLAAQGKELILQTGRGGEFYIENLQPANYPATAEVAGKVCRFDLKIPKSEETFIELGDVLCQAPP